MKSFKVTVNGNSYDVTVEEVGSNSINSQGRPIAPSPVSSAPKATPKAAPKSAQGNIKVKSPMPGTIVDIKVSVGDKVEANSVVVVLEAMKMENEIVTPSSGTIASINVSKGASVNTDDILVTLSE